jgi:hypothetical protein
MWCIMEYLDYGVNDRVFQAIHGPFAKHSEAIDACVRIEDRAMIRRHCVISLMSSPDNI